MTFDHEAFMRENIRRQMLFQSQQDALKRAQDDPVDGLLGGLFGIGLLVAGIGWALEWFWQKIGFAVTAILYPPTAEGIHQVFGYIAAFWLYLALPLAVITTLGHRAIARNIGQHRLRTAFWLFLPLIVSLGLLIAYIVKHDLTAYGSLLPTILWQDVIEGSLTFARSAPLWSRLCWAWSLISILWFVGGLLGLAFIRLLPRAATAIRLKRWLFGAIVIIAAWTLATWIKNTL
ncbi:MAG: hypothetical protein ACFNTM_05590 [Cardiobacterium sp.]